MAGLTGIPSLDFVIASLPAAEGMLVAAGQPELAIFAVALQTALKLVEDELTTRGFNLDDAIKSADAAFVASMALKFKK